uniref:FMRF amide-like peptide 32 n=1 Tax=Bursaphelenchus xylophilus TaxID=6326 RepID=A0A1I7RZY8_BURXY
MFAVREVSLKSILIFVIVALLCLQSFGFRADKKAMRNSLVRFGKRDGAQAAPAAPVQPEFQMNYPVDSFGSHAQNPVFGYYRRYYNNYGF